MFALVSASHNFKKISRNPVHLVHFDRVYARLPIGLTLTCIDPSCKLTELRVRSTLSRVVRESVSAPLARCRATVSSYKPEDQNLYKERKFPLARVVSTHRRRIGLHGCL